MPATAIGFAAIDSSGVNVASVSPHERGAMVNWLIVVARLAIHNATPDHEIEAAFRRYSKTHNVRVAPVLITEVQKQ